MQDEDGRVTILPKQFSRLADFARTCTVAIEVKQQGSVLFFNDGQNKLTVDADGYDVPKPHQE